MTLEEAKARGFLRLTLDNLDLKDSWFEWCRENNQPCILVEPSRFYVFCGDEPRFKAFLAQEMRQIRLPLLILARNNVSAWIRTRPKCIETAARQIFHALSRSPKGSGLIP